MAQHIKVIWKETSTYQGKIYVHRKVKIEGRAEGWIIDIEGDDNIYKTQYSARNAIDKALGIKAMKRTTRGRAESGIIIIGQKKEGPCR